MEWHLGNGDQAANCSLDLGNSRILLADCFLSPNTCPHLNPGPAGGEEIKSWYLSGLMALHLLQQIILGRKWARLGRERKSLFTFYPFSESYLWFFFGLFWISSLNRNKIKLEATHMTDRRIISLICKELLQIKKEKNQLNSIKWMKDTKR